MTETIKTNQHYYTKEFSSYDNTENNFVANQELTVTITLNEYRQLIEVKSKKDKEIEYYRNRYWEKKSEAEKLKEENSKLKNTIFNLQTDEGEEDLTNG